MTPAQKVAALLAVVAVAVPTVAVWEGKENVGYRDIVNIASNCYGHTGPDVVVGRAYSDAQCARLLADDALNHAFQISDCISDPVEERLPSKTYAAFVSFSYNVGTGAFCSSTMARKVNAGDFVGACNELPRWNKAGGRVVNGLVRRRADEQRLCLEGLQ